MKNRNGEVKIPEALEKIKDLKAVIFDVDGVLTNNQVLEIPSGSSPKWRSYYDGQGISLLRAIGIRICFITNEKDKSANAIISLVKKWNNLPSSTLEDKSLKWKTIDLFVGQGGVDKARTATKWIKSLGLDWKECAVMGDDLVDINMLRLAGLRVAPASAEELIKDEVDFVSNRSGGSGAIRDFVNFVLEVRGIDPTKLPFQ